MVAAKIGSKKGTLFGSEIDSEIDPISGFLRIAGFPVGFLVGIFGAGGRIGSFAGNDFFLRLLELAQERPVAQGRNPVQSSA